MLILKHLHLRFTQNQKVMKKIVLVLFVGLLALSVNAQDKAAKMEVKTENVDYGVIEKGTAPLIISKVSSSCGCTIPKKPEEAILPGKTGEIQVKYDTKRVGPIRKAITVISNADTPTKVLKIKGEVKSVDGK